MTPSAIAAAIKLFKIVLPQNSPNPPRNGCGEVMSLKRSDEACLNNKKLGMNIRRAKAAAAT
jgi:hypothetical protein